MLSSLDRALSDTLKVANLPPQLNIESSINQQLNMQNIQRNMTAVEQTPSAPKQGGQTGNAGSEKVESDDVSSLKHPGEISSYFPEISFFERSRRIFLMASLPHLLVSLPKQ